MADEKGQTPVVKLKDVADALDMVNETWGVYIDLDTGELVEMIVDGVPLGMREECEADWEEFESRRAVMLPDRFHINDYNTMREFAESFEGEIGDRLCRALHGRGAFRRFKDQVYYLGLETQWHRFRDEKYLQIAKDFLDENHIAWVEE